MKRGRLTFLFILCLCLPFGTIAQSTNTFEYLTIIQRYDSIKISTSSGEFSGIDVSEEFISRPSEIWWDYSPLIRRISDFEKEGWELHTNQVYANQNLPMNYALMCRRKP